MIIKNKEKVKEVREIREKLQRYCHRIECTTITKHPKVCNCSYPFELDTAVAWRLVQMMDVRHLYRDIDVEIFLAQLYPIVLFAKQVISEHANYYRILDDYLYELSVIK